MQNQINLTPESVIEAQSAVISELQGKVIALSAAVNQLSAENRSLREQVASLQDGGEKSVDQE
jgi:cell division protein FtsB